MVPKPFSLTRYVWGAVPAKYFLILLNEGLQIDWYCVFLS